MTEKKNNSIKLEREGDWIYLSNYSAIENSDLSEIQFKQKLHGTLGKYLFFSNDKKALINLGKKILKEFNLWHAKVPFTDTPTSFDGFGFVLCVYDYVNRFCTELSKYDEKGKINFRYWKSDKRSLIEEMEERKRQKLENEKNINKTTPTKKEKEYIQKAKEKLETEQ